MNELTAKTGKMNMVCDEWRDWLDVADKPFHNSTLDHQEYLLEYTNNTGLLLFPLLSLATNFFTRS